MTLPLRSLLRTVPAWLVLATFLQGTPARADPAGTVTLDTTGLGGGIFELAFVLTDGSGSGDANNTVTTGGFAFGAGGSAGAVDAALSTGGVSGDLITGVTLVDSDFLNILAAFFTAGDLMSFDFAATNFVDVGGVPDQFSLTLLQADGTPVPTTDPTGANLLLVMDIGVTNPVLMTYASELTPAPVFVPANGVPEPSGVALLALGLVLVALTRRRLVAPQRRR